ncbi:MAG: hypothetical protein AAGH87_02430 [Pseudomonadota bacterium]
MKRGYQKRIDHLTNAVRASLPGFVDVSMDAGQDQDTKQALLLLNVGFPSAHVSQTDEDARENRGDETRGHLELRLRHVAVRVTPEHTHFTRKVLDPSHLVQASSQGALWRAEMQTETGNTLDVSSRGVALGGGAKAGVSEPISGAKAQIGGGGVVKRQSDDTVETTNNDGAAAHYSTNFSAGGDSYSQYGGHRISITHQQDRLNIDIAEPAPTVGLRGSIFRSEATVLGLTPTSPGAEMRVKAEWRMVGDAESGVEIVSASGAFRFMKPGSKGRRALYEKALAKLVEQLQENTPAGPEFAFPPSFSEDTVDEC